MSKLFEVIDVSESIMIGTSNKPIKSFIVSFRIVVTDEVFSVETTSIEPRLVEDLIMQVIEDRMGLFKIGDATASP